jgi:hypothetical protein
MGRNNYYNNNYSPHMFFDGNVDGGYSSGQWQGMILTEQDLDAPITIHLGGVFYPDSLAGYLYSTIFTEINPGLNNLYIRVALIENNIVRTAPNGTRNHHQVLRDMIPSTGGRGITLVEGTTVEDTLRFTVPSPLVVNNCELVVFVQSNQNRHVLQAAKVSVPELIPDGIDDETPVPGGFALAQNYPNPFNAQTEISFTTAGGKTKLDIYDITGAKIATVLDASLAPGAYSIIWDGKNSMGQTVSSGTYLYRLSDDANIQTKRMTLIK